MKKVFDVGLRGEYNKPSREDEFGNSGNLKDTLIKVSSSSSFLKCELVKGDEKVVTKLPDLIQITYH